MKKEEFNNFVRTVQGYQEKVMKRKKALFKSNWESPTRDLRELINSRNKNLGKGFSSNTRSINISIENIYKSMILVNITVILI